MRYCNQCHRITPGEPLFCNSCGRSYDFRLCPSRHPNPRNAEICSECGSRELSTPHRRVPLWLASLLFVLSPPPRVLLFSVTVLFSIALVQMLVTEQPPQFPVLLCFPFVGV